MVDKKTEPETYHRTFFEFVRVHNCRANCHQPTGPAKRNLYDYIDEPGNPNGKPKGNVRWNVGGTTPPAEPPARGQMNVSEGPHVYDAFDLNMNAIKITDRDDQEFSKYASDFERRYSVLCGVNKQWGFTPIVDGPHDSVERVVVAHMGVVSGDNLIVPEEFQSQLQQQGIYRPIEAGYWLFVNDGSGKVPLGWKQFGYSDTSYRVLVLVDGEVIGGQGNSHRGVETPPVDPIDLIDIARVVVDLGKFAGRKLVQVAFRRGAKRALMEGASALLAKVGVKREAKAVKGAYNEITGITRTHHQFFIEVAAEKEMGIVVRHTNPKSIPLIEMNCPGKPKNLEFINTSPDTGIVMAVKPDEVLKAQRLGYFVAVDGKKAVRLVQRNGVEVTEELSLSSAFWKVEKGQVIDPKLNKPIVGDYDLMGVFKMDSPGRNVGLATRNYGELVTDSTNPIVEEAKAALNKRFDMPRVLHGPQDMYKGFRKGASVYLPDGTVRHFETEEAVKAFYDSVKRETRVGSYPRPTTTNPNPDIGPGGRRKK